MTDTTAMTPGDWLDPPAWMADALCAQIDSELFFPEGQGSDPRPAKRICGRCDVAADCLTYALEHHPQDGVWGGTTPSTRRRIIQEGNAA